MRRLLAALAALGLLAPAARAELDLEGTWYVLVHYQDSQTAHPEAWRWDDRVWIFERQGDRLSWTEYPIVVFEDETGRFEALGGNRAARVVEAWEPSPEQLADIRDGLQLNPRGSKQKTLRRQGDAWRSGGGPTPGGASIITYSEHLAIEDPAGLPVFSREDHLGAARAQTLEGRTEYRTEEVRDGGAELAGRFSRDGTREGRFRMLRAGESGRVGSTPQAERQRRVLMERAVQMGVVEGRDVEAMIAAGADLSSVPSADREAARAEIRRQLEEAFRAQGNDPRRSAGAIEALTRRVERLLFDEGKSVEEVQRMLASGQLQP